MEISSNNRIGIFWFFQISHLSRFWPLPSLTMANTEYFSHYRDILFGLFLAQPRRGLSPGSSPVSPVTPWICSDHWQPPRGHVALAPGHPPTGPRVRGEAQDCRQHCNIWRGKVRITYLSLCQSREYVWAAWHDSYFETMKVSSDFRSRRLNMWRYGQITWQVK